jgi:hypothetical protein
VDDPAAIKAVIANPLDPYCAKNELLCFCSMGIYSPSIGNGRFFAILLSRFLDGISAWNVNIGEKPLYKQEVSIRNPDLQISVLSSE